eukprot:1138395-Pelagomonas_calceolata.AAC.1
MQRRGWQGGRRGRPVQAEIQERSVPCMCASTFREKEEERGGEGIDAHSGMLRKPQRAAGIEMVGVGKVEGEKTWCPSFRASDLQNVA